MSDIPEQNDHCPASTVDCIGDNLARLPVPRVDHFPLTKALLLKLYNNELVQFLLMS